MSKNHSSTNATRHNHGNRRSPAWKNVHRNWRTWIVVGLMLAAMVMYVLSDDESIQPGDDLPEQPVPAATGL